MLCEAHDRRGVHNVRLYSYLEAFHTPTIQFLLDPTPGRFFLSGTDGASDWSVFETIRDLHEYVVGEAWK